MLLVTCNKDGDVNGKKKEQIEINRNNKIGLFKKGKHILLKR